NRRGTYEAYGRDAGVREQCVDGDLIAVHHVEDAIGKASLFEERCEQQTGRRVALGGFEYERIPASDGYREHPKGHHGREVERCDAGANAESLTHGVAIDTGADLFAVFPFAQGR